MAHQEYIKQVVSFFGPPGSGKGTVAQEWQKRGMVLALSTGALCRQHIKEQTVHGKEFKQLLDKGLLIPDALISAMVQDWLVRNASSPKMILLDGYPRTKDQVDQWDMMMRTHLSEVPYSVVLFEISDDALVQRLSQRLVCSDIRCQSVYSTAEGLDHCRICDSLLTRRHDDEPVVIQQRLTVYAEHKRALLAACAERGIRVKVFNVEHIALQDMFNQFLAVLYDKNDSAV